MTNRFKKIEELKMYDNSQVSTFQKCEMCYYLQYILGLRKIVMDDKEAQKNFGSYAHKFLECHFGKKKMLFSELVDSYQEAENCPQYSKQALKLFCRSYLEKYNKSDSNFDVLEVEKCSVIKIGEYDFTVKKDGAIKFQDNIYGLEHKTTKSLSYNYFDKYFLNSQISAQVASTIQDYGHCSGILLNVGEIKSLKRKPTGDYDGIEKIEDSDLWLACKFNRDFINRNKHELTDWKNETYKWIQRIEQCKKSNEWRKSTGTWGGIICAKCEYKELCKVSIGLDLDESILEVLYEKCNPFEYLEIEE